MKIITLCGSTKFRKEFEEVTAELTLEGNIVLSVGMFGHQAGMDMNSDMKRMLDRMHFKKIEMADEIFVINPGGYIGLSTCDEIYYAMANDMPIHFLSDPTKKMKEIYSCGCSCNPKYGHAPSCMEDNYSSETIWIEE